MLPNKIINSQHFCRLFEAILTWKKDNKEKYINKFFSELRVIYVLYKDGRRLNKKRKILMNF